MKTYLVLPATGAGIPDDHEFLNLGIMVEAPSALAAARAYTAPDGVFVRTTDECVYIAENTLWRIHTHED